MVNHSKLFFELDGATANKYTYAHVNGQLVKFDDTSAPYCNEPVDLDGVPANREERRHGKDWQLPEMQEEWKRRRG